MSALHRPGRRPTLRHARHHRYHPVWRGVGLTVTAVLVSGLSGVTDRIT